jgi:hypothetical protein
MKFKMKWRVGTPHGTVLFIFLLVRETELFPSSHLADIEGVALQFVP